MLKFVVSLVMLIGLAACNPPLAATPTAAPTSPPAPTTAAAPAPATSAPAGQPTSAAAAATSTSTNSLDAAIAKYYDAARQEGKLVVYGVGPAELYNPVHDAFVKRFPGIDLQGVDQRGRETREKIIAEQQSHNYVVDVAISGTDTQQELVQDGYVDDYQAADLSSVIPELVPPDRKNNPRTVTVFTVAINTNLVPPDQEPKKWSDLLDPRWKGKLEMDDPRGSGPGGTILSGVEALFGPDDVDQKLAAQNLFFATQAGPLLDALARGEYAVYLSSAHTDVIAQRQAGAPIKQVRPEEGVGITPINQALIKNAPHPNAAKLWIEWSLSEEGQKILAAQGFAPVRKGIETTQPEASVNNVKFLPRDDDPATFALLGDRSKRWEDVFFKGS
ncbi:MAG: extracellular solute-binding protein [Chloroflexi bacterium]|nr:extracellular solute-binding protein [Chloroflexota bacterium]